MFTRLVKESFARKRRRKVVAVAAIALGASVATAMLAVALGIGDKVNRELRSYGANIEVLPRQRRLPVLIGGTQYQAAAVTNYINEHDLPKLKTIFWANNILAFAPFLQVPVKALFASNPKSPVETVLSGTWFDHPVPVEGGKSFRSGVREVSPWWRVTGRWPDEGECLIGSSLAEKANARPQDDIVVTFQQREGEPASLQLRVSGIVSTGSDEDNRLITHLQVVQALAHLENKVERVEVSALTNPEDDFARSDPKSLSPEEYERWSCTPYARSIAYDITTAIDGAEARPVLRISQTEGVLLSKIDMMMLLVAVAALAASVLGVASTMMTTVLERKSEIGLLKAIGASNVNVTAIFLTEAAIVGVCGGLGGLAIGYGIAQVIARTVFNSSLDISSVLVPVVLFISVAVAFAGSAVPLRTALKFEPSVVLRGQ